MIIPIYLQVSLFFVFIFVKDDIISHDPYLWLKSYEISHRNIQQLVTEEDLQMMRSHTTELVNRARLSNSVILYLSIRLTVSAPSMI